MRSSRIFAFAALLHFAASKSGRALARMSSQALTRRMAASAISASLLVGCGVFESTESKQIRACGDDVKLGLNDPNSLEIISTSTFKADDGTHRLKLNITAKNALGGRVRGEVICGFKTEKDVVLNPDDIINKERNMSRRLRELKMK